jgi:glycosyltransferase involved in cell wall biosynthesis
MALVTQQSISVVFPAYNEEENIAKAVSQAIDCLEQLFPDWEIIDRLAQHHPRVTALHHREGNRGYGAALKSGIQHARKELIFFCDSDMQFHLSELLLMLTWSEQYDIVIGYREKRQDSLYRRLNAWGWKMLVRLLLGLKVRDIDCAFKLFRNGVFRAIQIDAVGAMVNTDILVQATRMGFTIKEIPVTHFPRTHGRQTGANLWVVLKAFKELFRLHHKLRNIQPVVFAVDRRQAHQGSIIAKEKRQTERRQVRLPINFPDRRRRFIRMNGTTIAFSARAESSDKMLNTIDGAIKVSDEQ